jgi:hypothetical protein
MTGTAQEVGVSDAPVLLREECQVCMHNQQCMQPSRELASVAVREERAESCFTLLALKAFCVAMLGMLASACSERLHLNHRSASLRGYLVSP